MRRMETGAGHPGVIRIRNLLLLRGKPVIVDDITLPGPLFPGLTERAFVSRGNTIYHFYQSRYGINVLRADERIAATLADAQVGAHLGVAAGTPLLEIRRTALSFRDRDGQHTYGSGVMVGAGPCTVRGARAP